jgi:4-amino-4-deoxy-L-arabinose transferase-like glycosyltransferase
MTNDSSSAPTTSVEQSPAAPLPREVAHGSAPRNTHEYNSASRTQHEMLSELWMLALAAMGVLTPFLGKPVHVDDPLFVWSAQQILQKPADFYGFDVNWYGTPQPMHLVNQNPPGAAYLLAAAMMVGGDRELPMHALFLLPNVALVVGTYLLASRFCRHAWLATFVACATPAVFVSATTLMCDNLMAACWCWAMLAWLRGLDRGGPLWFVVAGLLASMAALAKYFGVCVVPLMIAYSLMRLRRPGWWLLAVAIPIVVLVLYEQYSIHLYGHGLLSGAGRYIRDSHDWNTAWQTSPRQLFQALIFLGGCLITIGCAAPWCWSAKVLVPAGLVAVLAFVIWTALGVFPSPGTRDAAALRWVFPLHAVIFLLVSAHLIALAVWELARRDADGVLLCLWFGGTLLFAALGNWTITSRTMVPLAAPAGILLVRRLEVRRRLQAVLVPTGLKVALSLGAAVTLSVAWADYTMAKSARLAAVTIFHKYTADSRLLWFEGHWGFQYYIEALGARPVDVPRDTFITGEVLAVPLENSNQYLPSDDDAEPIGGVARAFPRARWVATISSPWRSKFYAVLGRLALPYVFGSIEPDLYFVYQIKRPFRFPVGAPASDP